MDGRVIRAFTPVFDGLCPAMTRKQAASARFYDPGASPRHFLDPGTRGSGEATPEKMFGGAERRWTLPFVRHPHRCRSLGTGGMRPDVVSETTPAHSPGGAPSRRQDVRAAFAAVSVPEPFPINRRCAGFPCARPGHGGQLWRALRSESRTVTRGLPGMACETIRRRRTSLHQKNAS